LLFNGSIVPQFHKYKKINKTKFFVGPKFMILRDEFEKLRKNFSISKKIPKNLLITFGGSDDKNITKKLIPFLTSKGYNLTAILGPSYSKKNPLTYSKKRYSNLKIVNSVTNMASLISKHDLVISSSGISTYELACIGIPSILIPVDSYQQKTAKEMMNLGYGFNFGKWANNFKKLEKTLNQLNDYEIRKSMSKNGRRIVDGKGTSRVVKKLLNYI